MAVALSVVEVLCGGVGEVFLLDEVFSPLIAAGASSFVLTQKNQKVKTEKTFCPQCQLPARFSVGPYTLGRSILGPIIIADMFFLSKNNIESF